MTRASAPTVAADHLALLREHAALLRAQADRYDRAIALIEAGERPARNGHPKREGRQEPRPTRAGRKVGKTRQKVLDYLAKHPDATAVRIATALDKEPRAIQYHLSALRGPRAGAANSATC